MKRHALVASKDSTVRESIVKSLKARGFDKVHETSDGSRAIAMAKLEKPGLVVLDDDLNDVNGITAAEKIVSSEALPVILIASSDNASLVEKALEAGVMGYVCKPVREAELWAVVDLAIHHYEEVVSLREEVHKLKDTLATRKILEQAKGLLMQNGMSEEQAHRHMQKIAMNRRASLKAVAEAILLTQG